MLRLYFPLSQMLEIELKHQYVPKLPVSCQKSAQRYGHYFSLRQSSVLPILKRGKSIPHTRCVLIAVHGNQPVLLR